MSSNVSDVSASTCSDPPAWGLLLGISMGVCGSIGINVGQNVQAMGLMAMPAEQRTKPFASRQWCIGLAIFAVFATINFAALALAPASVLTPLESIQFISNIAWNRTVNGVNVSPKMLLGTLLTMVGTIVSVVFGSGGGSPCHTQASLTSFWDPTVNPGWWIYLGLTTPLAVGALVTYQWYSARLQREEQPAHHAYVMPVTYTLYSALFGGAQMIVRET